MRREEREGVEESDRARRFEVGVILEGVIFEGRGFGFVGVLRGVGRDTSASESESTIEARRFEGVVDCLRGEDVLGMTEEEERFFEGVVSGVMSCFAGVAFRLR